MKSTELRLGNIVRYNAIGSYRDLSEPSEIIWTHDDWCAIYESRLDFDSVEPIPLTEEWLLKFGFKKSDSIYFTGSSIDEPDFVIDYSDREFYYCTKEYSGYVEDYVYKCRTELHYVHQLQNLYFALKGEELTLN